MTEREAKAILDAYEYHDDEDTGEIWRWKYVLTELKGELYDKTAYGFVVWAYSDNTPPDKSYAFGCWIGDDGIVNTSDAPMKPEEATALYNRSFSD